MVFIIHIFRRDYLEGGGRGIGGGKEAFHSCPYYPRKSVHTFHTFLCCVCEGLSDVLWEASPVWATGEGVAKLEGSFHSHFPLTLMFQAPS